MEAQPPNPITLVEAVYPANAELPANLLKFYLHFSRPMREGREIFDHIRLLDADGKAVEGPWRETELWTADARRLTLWIHPGRVKQGVNLRDELGPVLQPGTHYTLVVDAALRDAAGQPLAREFRLSFQAAPEVHERLDLAGWEISAPKAGTREPLRVVVRWPLDHALALRCLRIHAAEGEVPGKAALAVDERTWTFIPDNAWLAIPHTLTADPWLEDLAGNTFERAFDRDLTATDSQPAPQMTRAFQPR